MPVTVAQLASTLQTVLTSFADQTARQTGLLRRQRIVCGASFVQTLVFGWLDNPNATLEDLAQVHATVAGPLSPQALDQRFNAKAADTLRAVLQEAVRHVFAGQPRLLPLLRRFNGVYLLDGTSVSLPACLAEIWPGCGGSTPAAGRAALKVQLRWELLSGALDGLELHAGRDSDATTPLNRARLPADALRLADLGYFDLGVLQGYTQQGVCWLMRLKGQTAVAVAGRPVRGLAAWLARRGAERIDCSVEVGSQERLRCRLLAVRVPKAVARQRRTRLRKEARDKGYRVRAERLALCAWSVWISNVPAERLSVSAVEVLSRVRWQIELLFKLWKSHGEIDTSRSGKAWRVLCEVYAKLLAMVVQHWVLLLSWSGSEQRSLRKAARKVRQHALHMASVLGVGRELRRLLRLLQRCLSHGLKINKRRKKPAWFQLLVEHGQEPPAETRKEPAKAA
jgi:hypothetical protein